MMRPDRADGVTLVTDHPSTWGGGRLVQPHYLVAADDAAVDLAADAEDAAAADLVAAIDTTAEALADALQMADLDYLAEEVDNLAGRAGAVLAITDGRAR